MTEKNKFIKDLNTLINDYLTEKDIKEYIESVVQAFSPHMTFGSSDDLFSSYFKDAVLSEKVRLLTDTLITYVKGVFTPKKYNEFLLQFGKILLNQGENDLAYDIATMVLNYSENVKDMDNFRGEAYLLVAEFHMRQAIWKDSLTAIKKARDIFEEKNYKDGLGKCEFLIGSLYVQKGELKAGSIRLKHCFKYINEKKNPLLTAMVEVNMGIIFFIEGKMNESLDLYNKALSKFELLGDTRRKTEVLQNIGMIYRNQKKYNSAIQIYDECIGIAGQFGYQPILNLCFCNKAEIYLEQGDLEEAFNFAQKSLVLSYQLNDKLTLADIHKMLGVIALKKRNFSSAENFLLTSLRLNQDLNQELNCAETNYQLGVLYKTKGNKSQAHNYLLNAFKFYNKNQSKTIAAEIESHLSSLTG
jgi:tetratricopeptide (TPR) repeat protein